MLKIWRRNGEKILFRVGRKRFIRYTPAIVCNYMRASFGTHYNAELLDENFARWKQDPASVDVNWSAFFEGFELGAVQKPAAQSANGQVASGAHLDASLQTKVDGLVHAFLTHGHTIARLDPLDGERAPQPLMSLARLGFSEADMDLEVSSIYFKNGQVMKLRDMIDALHKIYSDTIGVEFMYIQDVEARDWVRSHFEARPAEEKIDTKTKLSILNYLLEAETFEHFLHTKYVGQKRFGLEGGDSLMVTLGVVLDDCVKYGVKEIVMGMAHRGRLNVLSNYLKKPVSTLFAQFSENYVPNLVYGDGDVKYHLGYATTRRLANGEEVIIRLSPNPSHLEIVNPVVEGMARARQKEWNDEKDRSHVLPILIHGDAAFAGQGVVAETLNLSQLTGYKTGGTLHIIVNNQIGFTTLPVDARSSMYATDVAKMVESPIFHVNGDDPLAVAFVSQLAFAFREKFRRDVVVDIYCYRRHGHNEGDEPVYTQPNMYQKIAEHPTTATIFKKQLIDSGALSEERAKALSKAFEDALDVVLTEVKKADAEKKLDQFAGSTAEYQKPFSFEPVKTAISKKDLERIGKAITTVPEQFNLFPKTKRSVLDHRAKAFASGEGYDWATGEAIAFGSLLLENIPVRLSGQDSRRGTFTQRHSVIFDAKTQEAYTPLNNIAPEQAPFSVYNSLLSEAAVLGFDYGYSLCYPQMLCMWEAQFGDFANGAQVVIDQFIAASESKWQRPSSIVLLLPHGYEGQGPEHSSARLERFLQLCAEDNMQVCNLTTPAQYFHALRRQLKREFRKPLIIMTPKSLLRHPQCVSTTDDFINGAFQEILPGPLTAKPGDVERVILCSGKVYYDLLAHQERHQIANSALIRVEQLYPLHTEALLEAVKPFKKVKRFVWCQEEPQNMGAWSFIDPLLRKIFGQEIAYAGRDAASSPAVGAMNLHKIEQKALLEQAFSI